jgi:hypothetical protein
MRYQFAAYGLQFNAVCQTHSAGDDSRDILPVPVQNQDAHQPRLLCNDGAFLVTVDLLPPVQCQVVFPRKMTSVPCSPQLLDELRLRMRRRR